MLEALNDLGDHGYSPSRLNQNIEARPNHQEMRGRGRRRSWELNEGTWLDRGVSHAQA